MEKERPWHNKKRYMIPIGMLSFWALASAFSAPTPVPTPTPVNTYVAPKIQAPVQIVKPIESPYYNHNQLSNNNYYTNTQGNSVHSPAYAPSVPSGASAQCRDGTYSFSQSRRGTCSHHGGVDEWLY